MNINHIFQDKNTGSMSYTDENNDLHVCEGEEGYDLWDLIAMGGWNKKERDTYNVWRPAPDYYAQHQNRAWMHWLFYRPFAQPQVVTHETCLEIAHQLESLMWRGKGVPEILVLYWYNLARSAKQTGWITAWL